MRNPCPEASKSRAIFNCGEVGAPGNGRTGLRRAADSAGETGTTVGKAWTGGGAVYAVRTVGRCGCLGAGAGRERGTGTGRSSTRGRAGGGGGAAVSVGSSEPGRRCCCCCRRRLISSRKRSISVVEGRGRGGSFAAPPPAGAPGRRPGASFALARLLMSQITKPTARATMPTQSIGECLCKGYLGERRGWSPPWARRRGWSPPWSKRRGPAPPLASLITLDRCRRGQSGRATHRDGRRRSRWCRRWSAASRCRPSGSSCCNSPSRRSCLP